MEALIQATDEVLAEHGRDGVTILRIAAKAGVSVGTLYQCFRHKDALLEEVMKRRRQAAEEGRKKPAPPAATAESLEDSVGVLVNRLVSAFADNMETVKGMEKADRDAFHRAELRRMAKASEALLARHRVPDPPHAAHVMTLSCSKVLKDALRHAPEAFGDGRLAGAMSRLCLEFIRAEQK